MVEHQQFPYRLFPALYFLKEANMASVNSATKTARRPQPKTAPGAPAARINKTLQLQRLVNACMLWEDNAYCSGKSVASWILELIPQVPASKCAEIAILARTESKLRHVPLLMVYGMTKATDEHRALVASTLEAVIQRPDELTEYVAIYYKQNGKKTPLSKQSKKGLAAAFNKFSEYQLGKYNGDGAVKLADVMALVHAKPKNKEQGRVFASLVNKDFFPKKTKAGFPVAKTYGKFKKLKTPDTWEVALSAGADKAETFTRLIEDGKLGAMALLRNLRKMKEVGVPDKIVKAGLATMNAERVLPFRFVTAAKHAPHFESELEAVMFRSLAEVEKLAGKTVLIIDVSGSMGASLSSKSEVDRIDTAASLGMLLREVCEDVAIYCTAGNDYSRVHKTALVPARRGFALRDLVRKSKQELGGGGIFLKQVMDFVYEREKNNDVARTIVITDEQDCDSHNPANAASKANAFGRANYLVNIASEKNGVGYGKWTHIDGWSESVLQYIAAEEADGWFGGDLN
jgi:60 kDa SS-A/Ro ribonucleoprotein